MSKYIEDVQGKIVSNPINETNTIYPYIDPENGINYKTDYPINTQYMYNHNEPVSNIDASYHDDYRNKIEELRKKTESTYEALESCLVPAEVPGMSFQPYEFKNIKNDDGEIIEKKKVKSFNYFFQDHLSPIGADSKEFVFRTNKVKFIDDRHRRLIYDRTIHIMGLREDEENKVSLKNVILRTFFEYYKDEYYSLVRNKNSSIMTYDIIVNNILNDIKKSKEKYIVIDNDGNEKEIESASDFDYVLQNGQDLDTLIPSSLYNLYNIGWVNAAMIFLNGLSIEWTKVIISVDNIDTFIIVSNLYQSASKLIDDDQEIFLDYVHIPFKVAYIVGSIDRYSQPSISDKYVKDDGYLAGEVIFIINKNSATITFNSLSSRDYQKADMSWTNAYDRIICLDPNIKYAEFSLEESDNKNLKDIGINYSKSFKEFCDNDYRCKLKQFNFLGFELDRYFENDMEKRGTFKNDDFTITWHPFNIIDIRFKRLFNRRRIFKVFYNTKVLYDQDNILRIKNHDRISDEYEQYRKDVTANIDTYINEIYIMAKKDIGTYYVTNPESKMYNYKYHYVTPYECFLLYNAINDVLGKARVSFDGFRDINAVSTRVQSTVVFNSYSNPKLTADSSGNCTWVIPTEYTECPVIEIIEISTNEIILADIDFNNTTKEISIIMNKDNSDIQEDTYKVTLFTPDFTYSNPDLKSVDNKCIWHLDNIDITTSSITAIYEAETNQVVFAEVNIVNKSVEIVFDDTDDIPKGKYKIAVNISEIDIHSFVNYLNGGFIAIPKDEESIFAERIDEEDIFTDDVLNDNIREYISNIVDSTTEEVTLIDILIPIDNERRNDNRIPNDSFYNYEGDTRGKIIPFVPIMNEFKMKQEYDDMICDILKLRFELCYLNNMEEGATPVDEFIYYFDNDNLISLNKYPIVKDYIERKTANTLNVLAKNVFKYDPNLVLESIEKMNWSADYIISNIESDTKREDIITTDNTIPSSNYNYILDPKFYYNYGYYDEDNIPHRLQSEWGLRRNLPEMFYWSFDENEYTLDSMHLLDEVFDFTYDFSKTYEENLRNGLNYIIGYDADKIEQSIKRSITSITRSGKQLKDYKMHNPSHIYCTPEEFKIMTFIRDTEYKVSFNNVKITAIINHDGNVDLKFFNVETGKEIDPNHVEMKYIEQQNPSIIKDGSTLTDVDKAYTATYTKCRFNYSLNQLEFYDSGNNVIVRTQIDEVIDYDNVLQMSRWNISKQNNYVMIFKNRKLYDKYYTIRYTNISFILDMPNSEIKDDDMFEFVFFLNANNTVIEKKCDSKNDTKISIPNGYYSYIENGTIRKDQNGDDMDKGLYESFTQTYDFDGKSVIACNTSIIEPENVQLLVNKMPYNEKDKYTPTSYNQTTYELNYQVQSYKGFTDDTKDYRRFIEGIEEDKKINGIHRVTKQGGGEYFLVFDGSVPEKTDSLYGDDYVFTEDDEFIDANYPTDRTLSFPCTLYLSSKRQFRYKHFTIEEDAKAGTIYKLVSEENPVSNTPVNTYTPNMDDFRFCIKPNHVLVFKNGLLLPNTYYYIHSIINTKISDVAIAINVPLAAGDIIDIFYVTNNLKHIETDYYDKATRERYITNGDIKFTKNNIEYRVMGKQIYNNTTDRTNYIKMRSPLYAVSSKHSVFVFLNGKKVRFDELEDISDTIMSIKTDYAKGEDHGDEMNATRLEVINHLDTQDIIERMYINDGLNHDDTDNKIKRFDLTELDSYAKRCLLDEMLNDLSDENLNKLFYNYDKATGPMTKYKDIDFSFIDKDKIIDEILISYYTDESDDWLYYIDRDEGSPEYNKVSIIKYKGTKSVVAVPTHLEGCEVIRLYSTAFSSNKIVTNVTIPEGIEFLT